MCPQTWWTHRTHICVQEEGCVSRSFAIGKGSKGSSGHRSSWCQEQSWVWASSPALLPASYFVVIPFQLSPKHCEKENEEHTLLKMKPWVLLLTLLLFYPGEAGGKAPQHTQGFTHSSLCLLRALVSRGSTEQTQGVIPLLEFTWSCQEQLPAQLAGLSHLSAPPRCEPRGAETNPAQAEKATAQGSRERSFFPSPCWSCLSSSNLGWASWGQAKGNGDCHFCHQRERERKNPKVSLPHSSCKEKLQVMCVGTLGSFRVPCLLVRKAWHQYTI